MHELSIVQDLLKLCETNALKNNATKIHKVEISVGKLSGVEPHYIQIAFDTFKKGTICDETELIAKLQDVVILCQDCLYEGEITENIFICPKCKSNNIKVTQGEDLMLMHLEMS